MTRNRKPVFVASETTRTHADLLFEIVQAMDSGKPSFQLAERVERLGKAMRK